MFHARAALNAKGKVTLGLRHIRELPNQYWKMIQTERLIDVLNRYHDFNNSNHTIHVMKYIFPRQFGLHNVFTSPVDPRETVQPFKDYTLREEEITRHQCRLLSKRAKPAGSPRTHIPKRLRGQAMALVKKLQKSHSRCCYTELLRHYCPVVGKRMAWSLERNGADIYQNFHRPLQQPTGNDQVHKPQSQRAQLSSSYDLCSSKTTGLSSQAAESRNLSMTEFATPASHVSAFCRAALGSLIPRGFWGIGNEGEANQKVIMQHVDGFIRFRRFENLSLHLVTQKLKVEYITHHVCGAQADIAIAERA